MLKKTNYALFTFGLLIATLVAGGIIPGLDILAWHLLHPINFWQKIIFIAVDAFTIWPRVLLAGLFWVLIGKIASEIS